MGMYYINYEEKANVNYCFIFCLYILAKSDKKEKIDSIIIYKSQKELADRIKAQCNYNISSATISRILADTKYLPYFTKSKQENKIVLNNNFKQGKAASNKFVILTDKEISFLLAQDNKQLNKYYLYLKYYCGYSKSKQIDTTAN